jgi:hypothetical protein
MGVPRGDAQDARASPLPPLCIPPPVMCIPPPPQPERLVMRKDEAVGKKKKMKVFLPYYKLDNNFWQLSPGLWIRIVLMRIRIQLKILMRIRIQIRGGGGLVSQKCASPLAKSSVRP